MSPGLPMKLLMHGRRRVAGEGRPSADVSPCRCSLLPVAFGKQLLGKRKPGAGAPPSAASSACGLPGHVALGGLGLAVGAEAAERRSFRGDE